MCPLLGAAAAADCSRPTARVIGVCNAADRRGHEGLYAALAVVQSELDRAGLAQVYRSPAPIASHPKVLQPLLRDTPVVAAASAPLKPEEQALLGRSSQAAAGRGRGAADRPAAQEPPSAQRSDDARTGLGGLPPARLGGRTRPDPGTRAQAVKTDAPVQNTSLEVPRAAATLSPKMIILGRKAAPAFRGEDPIAPLAAGR